MMKVYNTAEAAESVALIFSCSTGSCLIAISEIAFFFSSSLHNKKPLLQNDASNFSWELKW